MIRNFSIILLNIFLLCSGTIIFANQNNNSTKGNMKTDHKNPFFEPSKLPFQAPPFDKIQSTDFKPALEEGMKQELEEINKIADNPAPPTFENTFIPFEKSGELLNRVAMVFNAVTSANTDSLLQEVQEEEAPKLAAHHDAIFLNTKLFQRVKAVYDIRNSLNLDHESMKLVSYFYKKFVHAGANLNAENKNKLKRLNEEEATLIAKFINKLLAATKAGALIVNNVSDLNGLSPAEIDAASQAASSRGLLEKWIIPLQNTTQQPDLLSLNNRNTRKKLFESSWTRTEHNDANDTRC